MYCIFNETNNAFVNADRQEFVDLSEATAYGTSREAIRVINEHLDLSEGWDVLHFDSLGRNDEAIHLNENFPSGMESKFRYNKMLNEYAAASKGKEPIQEREIGSPEMHELNNFFKR